MCGRYTLTTPADLISDHFEIAETPEVASRFNIAPSQESLIVGTRADGSRGAGLASWGLLMQSGTSSGSPRRLINARAETVSERPSFRDGFHRRRCLVPADGFFEWQKRPAGKSPVYFSLHEGRVFAFAGIWDPPADGGRGPQYAILTTRPNELVAPVHNRMPVILPPDLYDLWLRKGRLSQRDRDRISAPFPQEEMQRWNVSRLVNSPANDTPECIAPVTSS